MHSAIFFAKKIRIKSPDFHEKLILYALSIFTLN